MEKKRILVVEDEGIIAQDIKNTLEELGYSVIAVVSSGEDALKEVERNTPDLVLMDIILQGEMDGIEAAAQIGSRFKLPVVYLTAYGDIKTLERAKVTEPFGYIIKPFENREILTTVEMAFHKYMMERRLKESEEWLSTTLRSIGDAVIATNSNSVVTFMNPIAQSLTMWKEEEAIGKPLKDVFKIFNEITRAPAIDPVNRVINEGVIVGLANHTVLIAKDGTETPIDDSAAPIRDDNGNILGVVLVFRDVTERRRAQRALQESREYAESIVQTVREPLVVLGPDLKVISANRSFYKSFETSPEKTEGRPFYDLDHRQWDIPKLRELLEEILPQNTSFDNFEVEHEFPSLGRRILILNARRIYRETNSTKMILLAIEDVTKRKRVEKEIQKSARQQAIVAELGQRALSGIALSTLMDEAVAQVAETLQIEYCKVLELLPDGDALLLRVGVGWKKGYVGQATVGTDIDSQAGYTLISDEPVIVEDLSTETRFSGPALLLDHGVVSGMSVIIPGKDRPFGIMGAHTTEHRTFTQDDSNFLQAIANVLAEAIQRKRAEEALKKSEAKSRAILNALPDLMFHISRDGVFLDYIPAKGMELFVTAEEFIGKKMEEVMPADMVKRMMHFINQAFEQDESQFFEYQLPVQATMHDYEARLVISGKDEVLCIVRDITKRKRAIEKIEHNYNIQSAISSILQISLEPVSLQEQLERILDLILSIDWLAMESKGCIFLVEDDKPDALVIKAQQGLPDALLTDCAEVPFGRCLCGRAASTRETVFSNCLDERHETQYQGITPHGHYCTPILSGDRLLGVINMYIKEGHKREKTEEEFLSSVANTLAGIIERMQAEEALLESEERYRTLIESASDCICHIDLKGKIMYMSPGGVRLNEFKSPNDACGLVCTNGIKEEYKGLMEEAIERARHGESTSLEYESTNTKGKDLWWESTLGPIKDNKGNVVSLVRISRAVTDRKKLEMELKDHVKKLEMSNRLKDVFTDILRHDLLNPISIIQNIVEMKMDQDLSPEDEKELEMIQRNIIKLQSMIDNATKYAKLENVGKLDFKKADINEIIKNTIERFEELAKTKEIEIINNAKKKYYARVNPFIEDVFTNIIGNALKYGPEKSKIIVDIRENEKNMKVMIKDYGEGVPDDYKEIIFHRFERIKKGGIKGTGLGLAIARRIVKLHKGKIWVEDNPEGGSIFYVDLPKA